MNPWVNGSIAWNGYNPFEFGFSISVIDHHFHDDHLRGHESGLQDLACLILFIFRFSLQMDDEVVETSITVSMHSRVPGAQRCKHRIPQECLSGSQDPNVPRGLIVKSLDSWNT